MNAEVDLFYNSIQAMTRNDLLLLAVEQYKALLEARIRQSENSRIETEIHIRYVELQDKYNKLLSDYNAIADDNVKLHDRLILKNKAIFGSHTEKMLSTLNKLSDDEFEDECQVADEDHGSVDESKIIDLLEYRDAKEPSTNESKNNRKKSSDSPGKSKLKESASSLPKKISYQLDVEALNTKYGEGNWSIAFWKKYETIEKVPLQAYLNVVFEPVIEFNNAFVSEYYDDKLIPHSMASASLLASIFYNKFVMGLPFYRQSADFCMHGLELSKQTIISWVNRIAPAVFEVISDYLLSLLLTSHYVQSDETYLLVLKDGRAPGSKSFMWVHCTSELANENPIVVFCYEPTRSTDHLREIFGDFTGYMTCDAYVSYSVMEKESEGCFLVTGCFMHARRYLSEALFVNDTKSMPEDEIRALPEVKALLIISDIYKAENKLKDLSADERLQRRLSDVTPLVDKFFAYIHELECSGEVHSDRLKKAITYAVNQEQYLRRFLKDGNIPLDNGQSERYIRSYSIGRANWIFADTKLGAKVNAICYSLAETAKANKVNPELYFQYLLEEVPKHLYEANDTWKADMTPWSLAYQRYESRQMSESLKLIDNLANPQAKPCVKKCNAISEAISLPAAQ